jgi:hypothetical protein
MGANVGQLVDAVVKGYLPGWRVSIRWWWRLLEILVLECVQSEALVPV